MRQQTKIVSPFTVTRPKGRASFESVIRFWDESPQDAFSVEPKGHSAPYGIWRPKCAANGNDFDVQIVSIGWAGQYSAGNPNPMTRRNPSDEQAANVRALIIALMEDVGVRRKIIPFSRKAARFLGNIVFEDDWTFAGGSSRIEGRMPWS